MHTTVSSLHCAALALGILAVSFVPLACDSGGSNEAKTCTLSAGPNSKDVPLTVEYTATITEDATISELTYTTNGGEQTATNLTSSWSKTVNVDAGTQVEITAEAEVRSGRVEVGYFGQDADGANTIQESDACDVNSD